jgi:hypothetical protein
MYSIVPRLAAASNAEPAFWHFAIMAALSWFWNAAQSENGFALFKRCPV